MNKLNWILFFSVIICSNVFSQENSPEYTFKIFQYAYLNNDWETVADLTNPIELSIFRNGMKDIHYNRVASLYNIKSIDSVYNFSNKTLYAFYLKDLYEKAPKLKITELNIVGTVFENDESAYIVYKNELGKANIEHLNLFNEQWKIEIDPNIRLMLFRIKIFYGITALRLTQLVPTCRGRP